MFQDGVVVNGLQPDNKYREMNERVIGKFVHKREFWRKKVYFVDLKQSVML